MFAKKAPYPSWSLRGICSPPRGRSMIWRTWLQLLIQTYSFYFELRMFDFEFIVVGSIFNPGKSEIENPKSDIILTLLLSANRLPTDPVCADLRIACAIFFRRSR